jgi:hypothetical protein
MKQKPEPYKGVGYTSLRLPQAIGSGMTAIQLLSGLAIRFALSIARTASNGFFSDATATRGGG